MIEASDAEAGDLAPAEQDVEIASVGAPCGDLEPGQGLGVDASREGSGLLVRWAPDAEERSEFRPRGREPSEVLRRRCQE